CISVIIILAIVIGSTVCFSADSKIIKIGVIGPQKFFGGIDGWKGATLAAEEINATGGVNVKGVNYKVKLIKADSNELQSVSDAVNAFERLVSLNKVNCVIGANRSEAALAMMESMSANKVLFLTTGVSHTAFGERVAADYEKNKYWFRVGVSNVKNIGFAVFGVLEAGMYSVKKELGIEKPRVAIFGEKAAWNESLVKAVSGLVVNKFGGEVSGVWRPSPLASDVTAELTAIKNADTHVIFTMFSGPLGVTAPRQWGQLQIPAAMIGINNDAQSPKHWEETGGMCNYEATYHLIGKDLKISSKTIPYYNKFNKKFGGPSGIFAIGNYDAIYLLKKAIEETGSLNSDVLVKKLENIDFVPVGGKKLVFYPRDHKWPHDVMMGPEYTSHIGIQWINGNYYCIWPTGRATLGDKKWEGVKFEGAVDYKLPPWMVKYWKNK
ncbi:ABC transporter substrate-binding protein, partial [Thermodesulfobacteriota bacterium]